MLTSLGAGQEVLQIWTRIHRLGLDAFLDFSQQLGWLRQACLHRLGWEDLNVHHVASQPPAPAWACSLGMAGVLMHSRGAELSSCHIYLGQHKADYQVDICFEHCVESLWQNVQVKKNRFHLWMGGALELHLQRCHSAGSLMQSFNQNSTTVFPLHQCATHVEY